VNLIAGDANQGEQRLDSISHLKRSRNTAFHKMRGSSSTAKCTSECVRFMGSKALLQNDTQRLIPA